MPPATTKTSSGQPNEPRSGGDAGAVAADDDGPQSHVERRIRLLTRALETTSNTLMEHQSTLVAHGAVIERSMVVENALLLETKKLREELAAVGAQLGAIVVETDGRIVRVEQGVAGFAWLGRISRHPLITPLSLLVMVLFNLIILNLKNR